MNGYPLFNPIDILQLLTKQNVKNELKISKDQESGITECHEKWREWTKKNTPDDGARLKIAGPDKEAKLRAIDTNSGEELFRSLGRVLKPEQIKRLKQILLQQWGIVVFDHQEIRSALKLSDEQNTALHASYEKLGNDLAIEVKVGHLSRSEASKQYNALSKGVPEKVRTVLTEPQRKTLKDLTGEPFVFE